eukprot:Selendium_serpulae@DN3816_c0_g1_i2.p1
MRPEKKKKCNRIMRFWKTVFGFREPYRFLVDGTFVQLSVKMKSSLVEDISQILGGKCIPVITSCALEELRRLGPRYTEAITIAKTFYRLKCGHDVAAVSETQAAEESKALQDSTTDARPTKKQKKAAALQRRQSKNLVDVKKCLCDIIGDSNERKYVVGSQDAEVIRAMRARVGVPLIHFHRSQIVFEQPSTRTQKFVAEQETKKINELPEWEAAYFQRKKADTQRQKRGREKAD